MLRLVPLVGVLVLALLSVLLSVAFSSFVGLLFSLLLLIKFNGSKKNIMGHEPGSGSE